MIYSGQTVIILASNEELAGESGVVFRKHGGMESVWRVWIKNLSEFHWVCEVDMRAAVR